MSYDPHDDLLAAAAKNHAEYESEIQEPEWRVASLDSTGLWEYFVPGVVRRVWDQLAPEARVAVFLTARLAEQRNRDELDEQFAIRLFEDEETAKRANAWGLTPDVRKQRTRQRAARTAATEMYPANREDVVRLTVPLFVEQLNIEDGDARELLTAAGDDPDRAMRCWTDASGEIALATHVESKVSTEDVLSLAIKIARGDATATLEELKAERLRNLWGGDVDDARTLLQATGGDSKLASDALSEAGRRLGNRLTIPKQFALALRIARE